MLAGLRKQVKLTQDEFADRLGISRQHVSKLENSSKPLSGKLTRRLAEVAQDFGVGLGNDLGKARSIKVISWAQAGVGIDYDELPLDWQKRVLTDCPDKNAFAVEIQGDSMEPRFSPADIAVLMPSYAPRNNGLVVARLQLEGVVFKVFTARGQPPQRECVFTSYNTVYQPIEVPEENVIWNYPVYQIIRQVWR